MTELTITTYENGLHAMLEHVGSLNMNERDFLKMNNILKKAFDTKDCEEEEEEEDSVEDDIDNQDENGEDRTYICKSIKLMGKQNIDVQVMFIAHPVNSDDVVYYYINVPARSARNIYPIFYSRLARICTMIDVHSIEIDDITISIEDLQISCDKKCRRFNRPRPNTMDELLRNVLNFNHEV